MSIQTVQSSAGKASTWSIEKARALYNVEGWGDGFFDINERGHVVVRPDKDHPERSLDLLELACDLEAQGVALPGAAPLLRHPALAHRGAEREVRARDRRVRVHRRLHHRVSDQGQSAAARRRGDRASSARRTGSGLECGSKPELQAVLALRESTDHLIVCNGYKDEEFMRLALMGQRLGHKVFIVIEQVSEIDVLLQVAEQMGVVPECGVRIKLEHRGSGRWAQSGGEKSKFGLSPAQLMQAIDKLFAPRDKLGIVKLIHCHLGSQITDIRFIKRGLQETGALLRRDCARWASTSRTSTSAAGWAWTTTARSPRRRRA